VPHIRQCLTYVSASHTSVPHICQCLTYVSASHTSVPHIRQCLTYVFELTLSQKLPTFICHFCSQKGCKIYLVGTKLDIALDNLKQRAVELDLITRYSNGIQAQFLETSSKTGENVGKYVSVLWTTALSIVKLTVHISINNYLRFCDAPLISFGPYRPFSGQSFTNKYIYNTCCQRCAYMKLKYSVIS